MTISTLLTRSLFTALLLPLGTPNILLAQVTPANDGTGTVVNTNGNQFNIEGGTLSGNGANLFHSLEKLGLNRDQIANFLANPQVQNILTRVVGGDASIINGLIQVAGGNANLYLMNPAGVIFGPNAMINVPGDFVVTTATGIGFGNDQWFNAVGSNDYQTLIGNPSQFAFDLANPGAIFNGGNLTVGEGKNISLIGGTVLNTGTISAPGGDITIAAIPGTSRVKISKAGNLVSLEVELSPNPDKSQKINPLDLPTLLTEGTIFPENTETNLAQGSVITEGKISAAGTQGGQVALIGQQVSVNKGLIDVSGVNGGGTVRVGGDYQGKGSIPNATTTLVDGNSQIKADGLGQGDGGRVIVWADRNTQFAGKISAKGGLLGGDGGFVETSGRNVLTVGDTALINTSAIQGETGTWLLDPTNLEVITEGGSDPNLGTISADTIVTNLNTSNVTLLADNSITVNQAIDASANTNPGNLTLTTLTANLNQPISLKGVLSGTPMTVNVGSSGLIQNGVDVVASGGTVNLAAGTYTQGETFISKSLNITGNGASNTTISGNDATRVFNISGTGTTVNLDSLKITNGSVSNNNGGGILVNSGSTLNLNNSTVSGNRATKGGGIFNGGNELTINNSTISDNIATSDGSSGIYSNNSIIFKENISLSSDILTLNDQTYKGAVTLQGNSSLTSQNINFQSTVDGHHALTISTPGTINFEKAVGDQKPLKSLTIVSETTENSLPKIELKGNVKTTGTQTYDAPIVLQTDVTLQGKDIFFKNTVDGNQDLTVNASGKITVDQAINTKGKLTLNGMTNLNADLTTQEQHLTINGNVNLGNAVNIRTENGGNIDVTGNIQGSHSLNLQAGENLNTQNIDLSNTSGTGATLALTATSGSINTGNLNAKGFTSGGDITIKAKTAITTGAITTSGEKAGNVFIDPDNDVQVGYINAQSTNGVGGIIDITTARFFRATETFVDQNGVTASLSSGGSHGGGAITIQYGSNGTTPFVVGDATINGTRGTITSGNFTINPTQSYFFNKTVGNISLTNGIDAPIIPNPPPPIPNPPPPIPNPPTPIPNPPTPIPNPPTPILNPPTPIPNPPTPILNPPTPIPNFPTPISNPPTPISNILETRILTSPNQQQFSSLPSIANYLNTFIPLSLKSPTIAAIQDIEVNFTTEYSNYLGLPAEQEVLLEDIPTFLASVQKTTGVKSALIYVFFRSVKSDSLTANSSLWELNRARNTTENAERRNDDELEVVLVSDQNILPLPIEGITRGQVLKAVLQLQQNLMNIAPVENFLPQSKELYQWLIAPIEDALKNEKITNLTFVLDQGLRSLPLAALYDADSQQYIIEKYSVSLIPSLSLTDTTRQDRKGAKVLGMGVDTFSDQNLLPAVPTELTEIAKNIWPGQIFLNQDFTVENFKNALNSNQFSIVHLATHGEFKSGDRNNSFVVFSDKKLTLDEFANLGLDRPIDLLTLSACQTALGDPDAELGFAGLAVKTGVRTALGSLWYVSDAGTLALMTSFYNQLKEAPTKADALRQAQLSLLHKKVSLQNNQMLIGDNNRSLSISVPISLRRNFKNIDTSHPYYWSAFTLIGNPW